MLVFSGCAARQPYAVVYGPGKAVPGRRAPTPNLVLGPSAEHVRIAESFAYRSTWPSVPVGYRVDDVSYGTEVIYDDQAFYDRIGGGYFRMSETVRTSALLR
jgi:hypothetical protein